MATGETRNQKIELIGLDRISLDASLQPRVGINMDHQRYLTEVLERDGMIEPVCVVRDGETYWLWDGHHRYGAYKSLFHLDPKKFGQIRCYATEGTKQDAYVAAAGANQITTLPRTIEDMKKQVWMLMDMEEWRTKSSTIISVHTGIGKQNICKWKNDYFSSRNIPYPEEIELSDGRKQCRSANQKLSVRNNGDYKAYIGNVNGKSVYLCPTHKGPDHAQKLLESKRRQAEEDKKQERPVVLKGLENLSSYLKARLIHVTLAYVGSPRKYAGLITRKGNGFVLAATDFDAAVLANADFDTSSAAAVLAIGQVTLAAHLYGKPCRKVVICYPEDGPEKILELGREMGFEFLTPDEFVESFKGKKSG